MMNNTDFYRVHKALPGPRFVILNRLNGSKVSEHATETEAEAALLLLDPPKPMEEVERVYAWASKEVLPAIPEAPEPYIPPPSRKPPVVAKPNLPHQSPGGKPQAVPDMNALKYETRGANYSKRTPEHSGYLPLPLTPGGVRHPRIEIDGAYGFVVECTGDFALAYNVDHEGHFHSNNRKTPRFQKMWGYVSADEGLDVILDSTLEMLRDSGYAPVKVWVR